MTDMNPAKAPTMIAPCGWIIKLLQIGRKRLQNILMENRSTGFSPVLLRVYSSMVNMNFNRNPNIFACIIMKKTFQTIYQIAPTATPPASVEFCTWTISNLRSLFTSADTINVVTEKHNVSSLIKDLFMASMFIRLQEWRSLTTRDERER
jgi:hypothetical protein